MKNSKTAIRELTARYRSVLLKCFAIAMAVSLSSGAMATDTVNVTATADSYVKGTVIGTVDLEGYATTGSVSAEAKSREEEDAKLKKSIEANQTNISTNANNIASLSTTVGTKADKATTLSGYGITDAYTKSETDGLLAEKVTGSITGTNGTATIFNEADGGGAHFTHKDGSESFVGVNDGGEDGLMAQIYADKWDATLGKWVGAKLDVTNDGIYYTVGSDSFADRAVADNEIATAGSIKDDLDNKVYSDGSYTTTKGDFNVKTTNYTTSAGYGLYTYDSDGKGTMVALTKNDGSEEIDASKFTYKGLNGDTYNLKDNASGFAQTDFKGTATVLDGTTAKSDFSGGDITAASTVAQTNYSYRRADGTTWALLTADVNDYTETKTLSEATGSKVLTIENGSITKIDGETTTATAVDGKWYKFGLNDKDYTLSTDGLGVIDLSKPDVVIAADDLQGDIVQYYNTTKTKFDADVSAVNGYKTSTGNNYTTESNNKTTAQEAYNADSGIQSEQSGYWNTYSSEYTSATGNKTTATNSLSAAQSAYSTDKGIYETANSEYVTYESSIAKSVDDRAVQTINREMAEGGVIYNKAVALIDQKETLLSKDIGYDLGNPDDETNGLVARLTALTEESADKTLVGAINANTDAIAALTGTGDGSVDGKIAANNATQQAKLATVLAEKEDKLSNQFGYDVTATTGEEKYGTKQYVEGQNLEETYEVANTTYLKDAHTLAAADIALDAAISTALNNVEVKVTDGIAKITDDKANSTEVYTKAAAEQIFAEKQTWVDNTLGIESKNADAVKTALTGTIAGNETTFAGAINTLDNTVSTALNNIEVSTTGNIATIKDDKGNSANVYTQAAAEQIFAEKQTWVDGTLGIDSSKKDAVKTALTGAIAGEQTTFTGAINALDSAITGLETKAETVFAEKQTWVDNTLGIKSENADAVKTALTGTIAGEQTTFTGAINTLDNAVSTALNNIEVSTTGKIATITDDKGNSANVYTQAAAEQIFAEKQAWVDSTLGIDSSKKDAVKTALTGTITGNETTFAGAINTLDNAVSTALDNIKVSVSGNIATITDDEGNSAEVYTKAAAEALFNQKEAWVGDQLGIDTTKTDVESIFAGKFTDQTADGKVGLVDAALQNKAAIEAEATRAKAAEGDLTTLTTEAKGNLVAAINEVDANVDAEVLRAKAAEGDLTTLTTEAKGNLVAAINEIDANVDAEVLRATGVEGNLDNLRTEAKTNLVAAINEVDTNIDAEVLRATTAEGVLTTNLANEVTRATAAEATLTTNLANEVTRATTAENVLTTNLANEVTRATAAEATLTTNLANEVTRAKAAEGDLTTLTTEAKGNLVAAINEIDANVDAEVIRAKAAEGDLTALTTEARGNLVAAINELDADVGDKTTLTTGAKTHLVAAVNELDADIGDRTSLTTDATTNLVAAVNEVDAHVDAEVIRATAAEKVLADTIVEEATIRSTTDTELANAIVAEQTNRKANDELLATAIDTANTNAIARDVELANAVVAETTRAKGAETLLQQAIDSEAQVRASEDARIEQIAKSYTDTRFDKLEDKMEKGLAASAALAGLVPLSNEHKTQLSAAMGGYGSNTAVAVGAFHYVNDRTLLNLGGAYGGNTDFSYKVGVTFGF